MALGKYTYYPIRHRLISFLRDQDIRGIRRLSVDLPKWILPNPSTVGSYILKTIHGFYLRIDPSIDKGVELSLHETGTYEKGILAYIEKTLKKGDCFIDVGANIGVMTLFASQCVGENGHVFSYEASLSTLKILEENIQLNDRKNIFVCPFALGATNGKAKIYDNWQVNRGGASLIIKAQNAVSQEVDVHLLDEVLPADIIPSMIKIDVEGFELEVLKGAQSILKKYKPILIVEFSEDRENVHNSSAEIVDFIRSHAKYSLFKLAGGKERKSKLIEIKSYEELPKHDNVICIPL